MKKYLSFPGAALILAVLALTPAIAAVNTCAECGMRVDAASKFSARLTHQDSFLHFCDIGDLIVHLKRKGLNAGIAEVRDFSTSSWIDARKAFYISSPRQFSTPMGWGIAAFQRKEEAAKSGTSMDFDGIVKLVK